MYRMLVAFGSMVLIGATAGCATDAEPQEGAFATEVIVYEVVDPGPDFRLAPLNAVYTGELAEGTQTPPVVISSAIEVLQDHEATAPGRANPMTSGCTPFGHLVEAEMIGQQVAVRFDARRKKSKECPEEPWVERARQQQVAWTVWANNPDKRLRDKPALVCFGNKPWFVITRERGLEGNGTS